MSATVMNWIAGWIPVIAIIFSFLLYYYSRNKIVAVLCVSVATVIGPMISMILLFGLAQFWSWLLLYLFLGWLACWVAHFFAKWLNGRKQAAL